MSDEMLGFLSRYLVIGAVWLVAAWLFFWACAPNEESRASDPALGIHPTAKKKRGNTC